ncbi:MAG: hypothetical protein H0T47_16420 [Planctomycetaceae bacterium]|nr:hypothetical protein [Planctomycetaceae bacterium]
MKYWRSATNVFWRSSIYAVVISSNLVVAEEARISLLKMAISEHRANLAKLETWQGQVELEDRRSGENGSVQTINSTVEFVYDRNSNATRWNTTYLGEQLSRGEGVLPIPGIMNAMRKDGAMWRLGWPIAIAQERSGPREVLIYPEELRAGGMISFDFDPLHYFGTNGQLVSDRLSHLLSNIESLPANSFAVDRAGSRVTCLLTSNKGRNIERYEIDLQRGGNLVYMNGADERVKEECRLEFEEQGGVWVPRMFHFSNANLRTGVRMNRTAQWTVNAVNEELGPEMFSLAALGASAGDRVTDTRTGTVTLFKGLSDEKGTEEPNSRLRTAFVLVNIGLLVIVLAAAAIISFRRSRNIK